jgi:hypothetical protein
MRARTLLTFALVAALSAPAAADKKAKPPKGKKAPAASVTVTFSAGQRETVRAYFVERHGRGNCPPGLAKKANGCLPPGQAKKRYVVGHPLPAGVQGGPLSGELRVRIGEPPSGYLYVMVDGDLLKLAVGTMLVVDAIQGLVD